MKKRSKLIPITLVFMLVLQLFAFVTNSNAYASEGVLRVQMYLGNTSQTTNTISPNFRIYNDSTSPLNMSEVKLRYYYTKDSSSTQNFVCDSCLYNNTNISGVTGNFIDITLPTSNSDNYLEITFPQGISLAPNSSIELRNRIYKSDWSNFNQSNDYSFNPTGTDYQDWNKVTAYLSNSLLWGSKPLVTPDPKKFLVIVSSKIYGDCQNELNTYMSDLSNEGWAPALIKVNNVSDSNYVGDTSFHVCENPSALKQVIRGYYDQGYEGFVLIGSAPSIPCAYWEATPNSNENAPTDLFYADMGNWTDADGDGEYEGYNEGTGSYREYAPDMIYGRISAGAISESVQKEIIKTKAYLSKIHDFRASGGKLSFEPKAFFFADDDFSQDERGKASFLSVLEKDVYSYSNKISTNKEKFFQLLQGGYRIGHETVHSSQTEWNVYSDPNGTEDECIGEFPSIDDINNMTVKVNCLCLNSCSACDYTTSNLGAAILFNNADTYNTMKNSYVYNVAGSTYISRSYFDAGYFEDLKSQNIGTAFKNLITRYAKLASVQSTVYAEYPIYILLGDPTINYNFTKPDNKCPIVTNDFSDVNAYPNRPFNITLQTTDPENDPVYLDITGLPEGAQYDSSTQIISWVPQPSDAGKSYKVTITAYNKDALGEHVNNYVQEFIIYVSRMTNLCPVEIPNPGFEILDNDGMASGWSRANTQVGSMCMDSSVVHSGAYSASITDDIYGYTTTVEPYTRYLISGYIKTSNVDICGASIFCLGNANSGVRSNVLVGTQDWTPVYIHWYSGLSTTLNISCYKYLGTTGTAWFDDIKLEKDYNLGFEVPEQTVNPISRWNTYSLYTNPAFAFRLDNEVMHSGLRSVRIESTQSPNYAYMYTNYQVEPNTEYEVSAWVKTKDIVGGTRGANLGVLCGSEAIPSDPVMDADTEWRQVSVTFNSKNNTNIKILCKLGDGKITEFTNGTAWFDDVTIEKK